VTRRIAIIPARGGSKGIPKKNLESINGVSLVRRSAMNAAFANVDVVIVSTDSEQIASEVNMISKVLVHDRSLQNSSDTATTEQVISEVLETFESEIHETDVIILLQPTSPFTSREIISECISNAQPGFSSFTLLQVIQFRWEISADNYSRPINHQKEFRKRRQDMTCENVETGACYTFTVKDYLLTRSRFSENVVPVFQNEIEAIDIDVKIDLALARSIATADPNLYIREEKSTFQSQPKMIITDFDGCLTNDQAILNEFGYESVTVNRKDGASISQLMANGIPIVILSSETNKVVAERARKLKVECIQGVKDKLVAVKDLLHAKKLVAGEIWYIGNDLNDLEPIKHYFSLCPSDAVQEIKNYSDIVLTTRGGDGIFVEISNILKRKKS